LLATGEAVAGKQAIEHDVDCEVGRFARIVIARAYAARQLL
jgi:hypothetical protein